MAWRVVQVLGVTLGQEHRFLDPSGVRSRWCTTSTYEASSPGALLTIRARRRGLTASGRWHWNPHTHRRSLSGPGSRRASIGMGGPGRGGSIARAACSNWPSPSTSTQEARVVRTPTCLRPARGRWTPGKETPLTSVTRGVATAPQGLALRGVQARALMLAAAVVAVAPKGLGPRQASVEGLLAVPIEVAHCGLGRIPPGRA